MRALLKGLHDTRNTELAVMMRQALGSTSLLVTLHEARVIQMAGRVHAKVGVLHPAANYQVPTSLNISEMLLKIISDNGLKGCDLSADLNPNMTTLDLAKWQVKLYQAVHKNPKTIFFVTCDCVTSIEAILHMDEELKPIAPSGFVKYQGDVQGMAWRGEDYVRIAGLQSFSQPIHALTQTMKSLTEPDQECVKVPEEPLEAAMQKTLSKPLSGKSKKKMRASARRNR